MFNTHRAGSDRTQQESVKMDYQRTKNNKYILPREVYNETLWAIRDYPRMKKEVETIMVQSPPPPDGLPRGTNTGDETYIKAMQREKYITKMHAIDKALNTIPQEYRKGVWGNLVHGKPYPRDAAVRTYGRNKAAFIYRVAENLNLI